MCFSTLGVDAIVFAFFSSSYRFCYLATQTPEYISFSLALSAPLSASVDRQGRRPATGLIKYIYIFILGIRAYTIYYITLHTPAARLSTIQ